MGSPCLFTRQRALKMGYFYWLRVKNANDLHTELSLGYPRDRKFYLEIKASSSFKVLFLPFAVNVMLNLTNLSNDAKILRSSVAQCNTKELP